MKALSLTRPWTTLIMRGHKNVENRTWTTPYRGPLVIHAAKSWDGRQAAALARLILDGSAVAFAELEHLKTLHPVGYLGVVDLTDVCDGTHCWVGANDRARMLSTCGPWAMPGQRHWRVSNVRPFAEPIPGSGRLGLWTPPPDVLAAVTEVVS